MPSLDEMRRHIDELLVPYMSRDIDDEIQVSWDRRVGRARVVRDLDGAVLEIQLAPVRSAISYATALHGHMRGRHQRSRSQMARERWAWRWARRNALNWAPSMERRAVKALAWYELRGRKA
jgi:hypothetical protein